MNKEFINNFISAARDELGTPWHHQGRAARTGIDCIGLLVLSAKKAGAEIKDCVQYKLRSNNGLMLLNNLRSNLIEVPWGQYQIGDVIPFWYRKKGVAQHIGIITKDCPVWFIHSFLRSLNPEASYVKEEPLKHFWIKRILKSDDREEPMFFRFKEAF